MDGARSNVVELEAMVSNLHVLIVNAASQVNVLNGELMEMEALVEIKLKKRPGKVLRATNVTIEKVLNQILNQSIPQEEGIDADVVKTRELHRKLKGLTTLLTLCQQIFKSRHDRIGRVKKTLDRLLQQNTGIPKTNRKDAPSASKKLAETTFPREIWQMIVNKVDTPTDLKNCADSCSLLKGLLQPSQTDWMFDLVLPHLADYFEEEDALNCRLVSKRWRASIDNYNWPSNQATDFEVTAMIQDWHELDQIYENKTAYQSQNANPFPGRALTIDGAGFKFLPIETVLRDLLSWSGVHVWNLTDKCNSWVEPEENAPQLVSHILSLRDCLGQLPNLRYLALAGTLDADDTDNVANWEATLCRFTFPEMPHLQSIEFRRSPFVPDWLTLIRKYSVQLVTFHVDCNCWFFSSLNPRLPVFQFPQLKELVVDHLQGYAATLRWIEAPRLEKFQVTRLADFYGENGEEVDDNSVPDLVFSILGRFPTLRHLGFIYPTSLGGTLAQVASLGASMYAPKTLETLEFNVFGNVSFSLLLRFPYLQHLNLIQSEVDEMAGRQLKRYMSTQLEVVQFYQHYPQVFLGDVSIYNSNIWRILPFLRTLTCSSLHGDKFVYRREAYEKHNECK